MQLRNRVFVALCALNLAVVAFTAKTSALALQARPDHSASTSAQEPQLPNAKQSEQSASKAAVFTGTIVKNGSDFLLKDASGKIYTLDTPEKAQPFEGKTVKVTGKLEADANMLHVETIEEVTA
jgi:hypothetical protein